MNWKKFKAAVEALGVTDEDEIGFIDLQDEPEVFDITAQSGAINLSGFFGHHGKKPRTVAQAVRR